MLIVGIVLLAIGQWIAGGLLLALGLMAIGIKVSMGVADWVQDDIIDRGKEKQKERGDKSARGH